MERILEGLITYTENPEYIIEFFIIYPPPDQIPEKNLIISDFPQKIQDLEAQVTEKQLKLTTLSNQLSDLTQTNSSLSFELEEKTIEISVLQESLKSCQSELASFQEQLSSTTSQLDQKSLQCQKLQKNLNDIKNNRKTAEVLLEKQETMNKDLISKNVKLEKQVQDLEKKNQENLKIIQKLKEEISSSTELSKQRDEQIKSIIKKVKILEGEKIRLNEEIRKKEGIIKKVQEGTGEHVEVVVERPFNPPKEMKKVMELLAVKDNEIKMMKDMIKSFQVKQHKVQSNQPAGKSVKLPPINTDKSVKKNDRSIRFRDPSQSSIKNLSKVESFVVNKNSKPGPNASKQKFKSLFTENDDAQSSPNGSFVNKSPLLGVNDDQVYEELKSNLGYVKNDKKSLPIVSKKLEKFIEVKDVGRKKLDFSEQEVKKNEERFGEGEFGSFKSEKSLKKEPVIEDEVRNEFEKNEKVYIDDEGIFKGNELGFGDRVQGIENIRVENTEEDKELVENYQDDVEEKAKNSEKSVNKEGNWGNSDGNWGNKEEKFENFGYKEEELKSNEDKLQSLSNKEENFEIKEEKLENKEENFSNNEENLVDKEENLGNNEENLEKNVEILKNKEEIVEVLSNDPEYNENPKINEIVNEYSEENFDEF